MGLAVKRDDVRSVQALAPDLAFQLRTGNDAAYAIASCRVLNDASRSLGVQTVHGPLLTLTS